MKYFLMFIVIILVTGSTNYNKINYSSSAFDLNNGKFLYKEYHEERYSEKKILESITEYRNQQNKLLSQRVMIFKDDLTKPKFELKDFRSGYVEGSEVLSNNEVKVYTRKNKESELEEKILNPEEPFVIDGGLTYFFIKNWKRLMNNETVEFNFIAPARLDYFRFRVSKNSIINIGGRRGLQLKLEINSFILRAFVDPIYITYDLETQKILNYKGISNINNEQGKSYSVQIDFTENWGLN
jgi:hypothetical protein